MKTTRKIIKNKFLFYSLSVFMFFLSCTKEQLILQNSSSYSGEDFYKAIFFGTGELSSKIEVISNSSLRQRVLDLENNEKLKLDQSISETMNALKSKKQNYFEYFGKVMKSGNHLLIKNTLCKYSEDLYNQSMELYLGKMNIDELKDVCSKIDFDKFMNEDGTFDEVGLKKLLKEKLSSNEKIFDPWTGVVAVWYIYLAVAVHTYGAVGAIVYAGWYKYTYKEKTWAISGDTGTDFDVLVNDLVEFNS